MPENLPPPILSPWLERHIGPCQIVESHRVHSERTGVWRIRARFGDYFLKLYTERRKWHPEVYAYRHWAPACRPYVPELVAVLDEPDHCGILTTALNGAPLREANPAPEKWLDCYAAAGALLRRLHDVQGDWFGVPDCAGEPAGFHASDPVDYMRSDFHAFYDEAMALDCLTERERGLADWALQHFDLFAGETPVASHRDFTPGNWLVDAGGRFAGLIDLECMQWSVAVDSLPMLIERYFPDMPGSAEAFFGGYGPALTDLQRLQVRHVCIKVGIADIAWGTRRVLERNIRLGRDLLSRIEAGEHLCGWSTSLQ